MMGLEIFLKESTEIVFFSEPLTWNLIGEDLGWFENNSNSCVKISDVGFEIMSKEFKKMNSIQELYCSFQL